MPDQEPPGRRGSDVLDAIWDKVADKPERSGSAQVLFRAQALEQLDVAAEVDNQLPLVSRRNWLVLVGVGVLVLALLSWASLTPSITTVTASGRVVASPGAAPVVSPTSGVLLRGAVAPGVPVNPGQRVATVRADDADTEVTTLQGGTVWQVLAVPGEAVVKGRPLITLLPSGSDGMALLAVPESQASAIRPGMGADIFASGSAHGTVTEVAAPLPAADASQRTGLALPQGVNYCLVTVQLATPLPPGAAASGQIILSDSTVLSRLVGPS